MGAKLPPVRDLAFLLGVSPATISQAWSDLRRHKIIGGRGRNGAWVLGDRFTARPERLASSGNYGSDVINLATAVPDSTLLPLLDQAMAHGARAENLNSYERVRILPELQEAVQRGWPYSGCTFLATNGGYNAVYTVLHALVRPGSPVAIEDPTALRLLDILEDMNVPIIPVECDLQGPIPASLEEALKQKPSAFLFQPRIHAVTGHCVTQERLKAIGDLLVGTETLIIEDDGVADITDLPRISLGDRFPDRVIHILSFSKTLGPDLRLAVLSSSASVVEQIQSYRSFSAGWTSRILQSAAAWLLNDPITEKALAHARTVYRYRREELARALARRGVEIDAGFGISVFIPVPSESYALVTLAARGFAVSPGTKYSMRPTSAIRIATGILQDEIQEPVAEAILLASRIE